MATLVECIGAVELWLCQLRLAADYRPPDMQEQLDSLVRDVGVSVVGGLVAGERILELMRWPETRPGYTQPSIEEHRLSATRLARRLGAVSVQGISLDENQVYCMMGLKVGGYGDGRVATVSELARFEERLTVTPAHMVSARALRDGSCESYGEPTVILTGSRDSRAYIHEIGNLLQQHHYAISCADGTRLYQTGWAG